MQSCCKTNIYNSLCNVISCDHKNNSFFTRLMLTGQDISVLSKTFCDSGTLFFIFKAFRLCCEIIYLQILNCSAIHAILY